MHLTIQEALGAAAINDYEIIELADGTYTGVGNKDLNYLGKAVMVVSKSGPDHCVIDCEQSGRGFYFRGGEGRDSVLKGVTIQNGLSGYGSGIFCYQASPTIIDCVIDSNTGTSYAGGVLNYVNAEPLYRNCKILNNSGGIFYGGGVWNFIDCNVTFEHCVIAGNHTPHVGAGICNVSSTTKLLHCTIVNNDGGQGIYNAGGSAQLTMKNSIVWGNTQAQINGDGFPITYSCAEGGYTGTGNIEANPLLAPDGYHLLEGSPCIDRAASMISEAFYISMDGGAEDSWDLFHDTPGVSAGTWTYDALSLRCGGPADNNYCNPWIFNVIRGNHTLTFRNQSNGARLDHILITSDFAYHPVDDQRVNGHEYLELEAEAAALSLPMQVVADPLASGGSYIRSPMNEIGEATFSFTVSGGDYVVWVRAATAPRNHARVALDIDGEGRVDGAPDMGADEYTDSDSDGIPDYWEVAHQLNPTDPSDAAADPDGDDASTLQEYLRGTDHLDVSSVNVTFYVNAATGSPSHTGLKPVPINGDGPLATVEQVLQSTLLLSGDAIEMEAGAYTESLWDLDGHSVTLRPQGTVRIN